MAKKSTNPLFAAVQEEVKEQEQKKNEIPIVKKEPEKEENPKITKRQQKKKPVEKVEAVTTIQVNKSTHLKLKLLAKKSNKTYDEYLAHLCDNAIKRHPDKEKMLNYINLSSEIF